MNSDRNGMVSLLLLAIAISTVFAPRALAQTSAYFLVSGDQATFTVVQNGHIVRQWGIAPDTDDFQYPIAVRDTIRTMGRDALDAGAEYDFEGNFLGTRFVHPFGTNPCWDGTTDGEHNYTIDTGGYVWQYDLDWSNQVELFQVNGLGSLAYDSENDSLWITQAFNSNLIIEYSKSGTRLRSIDVGHDRCHALALDPADDTLWLHHASTEDQGTLEQWTKDGTMLNRIAVPGLEEQIALGGEFAFGAGTSPTLTVNGDCPGRMRLVANNMTGEGNVAFVYAFGEGDFVIPGGPCAGTTLGLDATVTLGAVKRADPEGSAILEARLPNRACGRVYVQAIDVTTCGTTNTVGL